MGQKISHKALHTMDPMDLVFPKYVIATISTFVEWYPSEKIMVHNGVNQKDNILLKPFLYMIT